MIDTDQSPLLRHLMLLKTKPRIFLGGHDVVRLNAHLYGWKAHRHHFPDGDAFAARFFDGFHLFVAKRYGETRKVDWHDVIQAQEPDPRAQLALFYSLLEDFRARHPADD